MHTGIPSDPAHFNPCEMGSQGRAPRLEKEDFPRSSSMPGQLPSLNCLFQGRNGKKQESHTRRNIYFNKRQYKGLEISKGICSRLLWKSRPWETGIQDSSTQLCLPSSSPASSSVLAAGKHHDLPVSREGAGSPPELAPCLRRLYRNRKQTDRHDPYAPGLSSVDPRRSKASLRHVGTTLATPRFSLREGAH